MKKTNECMSSRREPDVTFLGHLVPSKKMNGTERESWLSTLLFAVSMPAVVLVSMLWSGVGRGKTVCCAVYCRLASRLLGSKSSTRAGGCAGSADASALAATSQCGGRRRAGLVREPIWARNRTCSSSHDTTTHPPKTTRTQQHGAHSMTHLQEEQQPRAVHSGAQCRVLSTPSASHPVKKKYHTQMSRAQQATQRSKEPAVTWLFLLMSAPCSRSSRTHWVRPRSAACMIGVQPVISWPLQRDETCCKNQRKISGRFHSAAMCRAPHPPRWVVDWAVMSSLPLACTMSWQSSSSLRLTALCRRSKS
eukprot:m.312093 g.312093  ORF g.312093 m.312093 type:complete len:307 (-) comp55382_c1_seq4:111-1031(-)